MRTGRLIRFDVAKGFGFIAPNDGGEDVFLHISSVLGDASALRPGMTLEYEPLEGDQGVKALTARVVKERAHGAGVSDPDSDLCEVVSAAELSRDVTDILITSAPALNGAQIMEIRTRLTEYARARRWLED